MRQKTDLEKSLDYWKTMTAVSIVLNLVVLFTVVFNFNRLGHISNYDTLALSITTIEIFLVIVGFGGIWILSGVVEKTTQKAAQNVMEDCRNTAEEAARDVAERIAISEQNSVKQLKDLLIAKGLLDNDSVQDDDYSSAYE